MDYVHGPCYSQCVGFGIQVAGSDYLESVANALLVIPETGVVTYSGFAHENGVDLDTVSVTEFL